MTHQRVLHWEGLANARDLGGIPTRDGGAIRPGALVRSEHPAKLTAAGWAALHAHGISTILSLVTDGLAEPHRDMIPPAPDITVIHHAIEDITVIPYREKWASSYLWSTPLYYPDALALWPDRHAAALTAIARAKEGGVLFHCQRGVDRTGLVALLLLAAVGAAPGDILADYLLSHDPAREGLLAAEGTTTREVILGVLDGLDIEAYLRRGGMTGDDLAALRERVVSQS